MAPPYVVWGNKKVRASCNLKRNVEVDLPYNYEQAMSSNKKC